MTLRFILYFKTFFMIKKSAMQKAKQFNKNKSPKDWFSLKKYIQKVYFTVLLSHSSKLPFDIIALFTHYRKYYAPPK